MNVLFTLCGRAGSKGVKGKNARDFLDIPLAWYSMAGISIYRERYTSLSDRIDIVLNTDSEDLIRLVKKVDDLDVTVFNREKELAGDKVPKVAVVRDCLNRAEAIFNTYYDVVVDLDLTSPLRTVDDIKRAIERKFEREDTDVVYSVTNSRRNPYFNMVKKENGYFIKAMESMITTRQEAPLFFDVNASIYAYSPSALKNKDMVSFFNSKCDAILMTDTGILDIDSEEDYELMQVVAKYFYERKNAFKEIYNLTKTWL